MIVVALLLVVAVYGGLNLYIGMNLFSWLQLVSDGINGMVFAGGYSFCALTPLLAMIPASRPRPFSRIMSFIGRMGDYWMGIFLYSLLVYGAMDLILSAGLRLTATSLSESGDFISGLIAVLAITAICVGGRYHAGQLQHVSYEVTTAKAPLQDQFRIVLISDIHIGYTNDAAYLERLVTRINEKKPDLVCIAGDIFNGSYHALAEPERAAAALRRIESRYGVYGCLGNHDAGTAYQEIVSFCERSNITLLQDEAVVIAGQLVLAGRKDSAPIGRQGEKRMAWAELAARLNPELMWVVMDHSPSNIGEYGRETDLILCGHTHRGQVFPGNLATKAMFEVDYGQYQKDIDSPQVIVTSGAGTWGPPMRTGTDSEIVEISIGREKIQKS